MKNIMVVMAAIISVIYLINPTAGIIELLPDNLPIIGNLDEVTAAAVLLACARYFGFDLSAFFGKRENGKLREVIDIDTDKDDH
jgi:uncharacterized membrane protein YkvA (DUF1232 family)